MHGISIKKVTYIKNESICAHSNKIENVDSSYLVCQNCGKQLQQIFRCSATGNSKPLSANASKHEKNEAYDFIDNCICGSKQNSVFEIVFISNVLLKVSTYRIYYFILGVHTHV